MSDLDDEYYSNNPSFLDSKNGTIYKPIDYRGIDNINKIFLNIENSNNNIEKKELLNQIATIRTSTEYNSKINNLRLKVNNNYDRLFYSSLFIIFLTLIVISTPIGILIINNFPNSENNLLKNNIFKTSLYIILFGGITMLFFMLYNIFGKLRRIIEILNFISLLAIMIGIIMFWSISYKLNILENYIGIILIVLFIFISISVIINFYKSKNDINNIKELNAYDNIDKKIHKINMNLFYSNQGRK